MNKQIAVGTTGAFAIGIVIHLGIPLTFGMLLAEADTGISYFDPIYDGRRLTTLLSHFGGTMLTQVDLALLAAPITGGLATRIKSSIQLLFIGLFISLLAHVLISGLFLSLRFSLIGYVMPGFRNASILLAPVIGLVSFLLIRTFAWESKDSPNRKQN